jgi:hypothetical protein
MPEGPHQEDEAKTHLEDKDKTYFGDVLIPGDKDQQTPNRRLNTDDSTHLTAGEYKTCHMDGYNAMHVEVDTKYEITLTK